MCEFCPQHDDAIATRALLTAALQEGSQAKRPDFYSPEKGYEPAGANTSDKRAEPQAADPKRKEEGDYRILARKAVIAGVVSAATTEFALDMLAAGKKREENMVASLVRAATQRNDDAKMISIKNGRISALSNKIDQNIREIDALRAEIARMTSINNVLMDQNERVVKSNMRLQDDKDVLVKAKAELEAKHDKLVNTAVIVPLDSFCGCKMRITFNNLPANVLSRQQAIPASPKVGCWLHAPVLFLGAHFVRSPFFGIIP